MSTADEDRIAARRAEAIALRIKGFSVREIAKNLGIGVATAHSDITAVMSEIAKRTAVDADVEREIQLERLDKATQLCMQAIAEGELAAVDRLVKLEDRRSKLLGTDAPERSEVVAKLTEASPEEAARLVREQFGERATPKRDDSAGGA